MTVFASPAELEQTWTILAAEPQLEGVVLWGSPWAENLASWNHTAEVNVSDYFNSVWGPFVQQHCEDPSSAEAQR